MHLSLLPEVFNRHAARLLYCSPEPTLYDTKPVSLGFRLNISRTMKTKVAAATIVIFLLILVSSILPLLFSPLIAGPDCSVIPFHENCNFMVSQIFFIMQVFRNCLKNA